MNKQEASNFIKELCLDLEQGTSNKTWLEPELTSLLKKINSIEENTK